MISALLLPFFLSFNISAGKDVIAYDLRQKIPFEDNTFELVYHSHLLEHFPKPMAESFIKECCRVLRPQGILRVYGSD
ncbi:MAG: methyltransferase domain-containing protein [Pleurocapsa sp.]